MSFVRFRAPAREGITDRFGQSAAAGDVRELLLQPRLQGVDHRPCADAVNLLACSAARPRIEASIA